MGSFFRNILYVYELFYIAGSRTRTSKNPDLLFPFVKKLCKLRQQKRRNNTSADIQKYKFSSDVRNIGSPTEDRPHYEETEKL